MKREVAVGYDTYLTHKELLRQVFNDAGLWIVPTNLTDLTKQKTKMTAVFTQDEIKEFGLKTTKGWVARLLPNQPSRVVVFPELIEGGDINWKAFTDSLKLMVAVDTSELDVRVIRTEADRKKAMAWLAKQKRICVDFETKGTEPHDVGGKLLSVAFGNKDMAYVMALEHKDSPWLGKAYEQDSVLNLIHSRELFDAHNSKFELRWFLTRGFPIRDVNVDPMLIHSLLHEDEYHDLGALATRYTKYGGYHLKFEGTLKSKKDYESAPIEELLNYNALDVIVTALIAEEILAEIKAVPSLYKYWLTLTKEFIPMVADMEEQGFVLDQMEILRLFDWYEAKRLELEDKIKSIKACKTFFKDRPEFNFGSYPQMREFLYDHLGFKIRQRTDPSPSCPEGNPSTDEDAIALMRLDKKHEDVLDALALRSKAYTMVKSFINVYAKRLEKSADGKIHCSFNIHVVETGRLSSSGPNMQSMPTSSALLDLGLQPIKSVFVSRFKGGKILSADESQMELRISAVYSKDTPLVRAFAEKRDLHSELAQEIYGEDFTKAQRTKAKRVNFSAVFDIGAKALASDIKDTEVEAKRMLKAFKALHAELFSFFDNLWDEAQLNGYTENLNGRRRHIVKELEEAGSDFGKRDHVRRSVWNFPIQSTAVEIALYSTLLVWKEMRAKKMKSVLIGQVHDSVIIDVHPSEEAKVVKLVKDKFMSINKVWTWIDVPIVTDVSIGPNLFKLEKV